MTVRASSRVGPIGDKRKHVMVLAKPCPFCGGKGDTLRRWTQHTRNTLSFYVSCNTVSGGCGARGPRGKNMIEAIIHWNVGSMYVAMPETKTRGSGSVLEKESDTDKGCDR